MVREDYSDGDPGSVLALTVFALGQMASEGTSSQPKNAEVGFRSGFHGGCVERPPGIELFCEARRRICFVTTPRTLENIQILLLQGTYFEANARHMDFWSCTASASAACEMLIRCKNFAWSSAAGEAIARAYWACVMGENVFRAEPGLPPLRLNALQDQVPLPYSTQTPESLDFRAPGDSLQVQLHFLAMITLQRLIMRVQDLDHRG